jgi:N-acetyl-anhydromuramyl-L-alanine amidase AmpD
LKKPLNENDPGALFDWNDDAVAAFVTGANRVQDQNPP